MSSAHRLLVSLSALATLFCLAACSKPAGPWLSDETAALCARITACAPPEQRTSVTLECLYALYERDLADSETTSVRVALEKLARARRAEDCDAMLACTDPTAEQDAACGPGLYGACLADVAVACDPDTGRARQISDCGAADLVCGEDDEGWAACGTEACDPETFEPRCDGPLLLECRSGVVDVKDCRHQYSYSLGDSIQAQHGGTCGVEEGGNIGCVGDGRECDGELFQTTCDGDTLVSCKEGRLARFDCGQFHPDETCRLQGSYIDCGFVEDECELGQESCADGVLTFCVDSRFESIDCRAYGYSGCATDDLDGEPVVYCVE